MSVQYPEVVSIMSDLFRKCLIAGAVAVIGSLLGSAAESDALAISSNIQARHVPYGAILDPVYAAPNLDDLTGYTRCGDSALWTGTYLAAEAFRYKVTGSQDALANAKNAFAGIKGLADVTGYNLLARCMIPLDSPYAPNTTGEQQSNGIYTNSSAGWYWIGNTSRDEYSGVFFGLAVAYDMIDDSNLKSEISALVTRLLDYLRGHGWTVFNPDGSLSTTFIIRADQQLSFLQVGRHVNPNHYSTSYDVDKIFWSAEILAPIGVDVLSNDSYFKFNLDYMNLYNLIRLESSSFKDIYEQAYSVLRNHTDDQKNAHFNMIDLALNGPDASRDTDTASMLSIGCNGRGWTSIWTFVTCFRRVTARMRRATRFPFRAVPRRISCGSATRISSMAEAAALWRAPASITSCPTGWLDITTSTVSRPRLLWYQGRRSIPRWRSNRW